MASVQQITYQMIIDYLSPNKVAKMGSGTSSFPTKENIVINVNDFPKKIKRFFNKNFFRYGILSYDNNHNNISIYSSLLTCLDSSFITMNKDNKITYVNAFKKKLKNDFINKKLFKKFNYAGNNISEKVLINNISEKVTLPVVQSLVDYLSINIIIFNFDDNKRYLIHSKEIFNVYYPTVILGFSNDYYEPIFTNKKKSFTYNDKIIRKILKNNLIRMSLDNVSEFSTNKDVNSIIQEIVDMNKELFETNDPDENIQDDILLITQEEDDEEDDEEYDDDTLTQTTMDDEEDDDSQSVTQELDQDDSSIDDNLSVEQKDDSSIDDNLSVESDTDKNVNTNYQKYRKYSKSKWNKMRKDELLDIINILKLNVGKYQNKKKSDVIKDIINTISL